MHRPAPVALLSRWLPVMVYAGAISYLSSRTGLDIPGGVHDKIAHAVEFGVLGGLLWRASGGSFLCTPRLGRLLAVAAACTGYAILDEIHQAFVPGRESSVGDVAADVTGAVLVLGILGAISLRRERPGEAGAEPAGTAKGE